MRRHEATGIRVIRQRRIECACRVWIVRSRLERRLTGSSSRIPIASGSSCPATNAPASSKPRARPREKVSGPGPRPLQSRESSQAFLGDAAAEVGGVVVVRQRVHHKMRAWLRAVLDPVHRRARWFRPGLQVVAEGAVGRQFADVAAVRVLRFSSMLLLTNSSMALVAYHMPHNRLLRRLPDDFVSSSSTRSK